MGAIPARSVRAAMTLARRDRDGMVAVGSHRRRIIVGGAVVLVLALGALGAVRITRSAQAPQPYTYPRSKTPPISLPPSAEGQRQYEEHRTEDRSP